jgi:hypothetical protein
MDGDCPYKNCLTPSIKPGIHKGQYAATCSKALDDEVPLNLRVMAVFTAMQATSVLAT